MKSLKTNILLFALLLNLVFLGSCKEIVTETKPNIVYILTDQWRGSATGYAGDPNIITPNLDQFAKESVNFANAVSVAPVCTPHRASLLTGRYPTSTGMFLNDLHLPSEELCMAEIFKAEGYQTAYLGKWHLDGHGRMNNVIPERRQGFDYWKALECSHNYKNMPYYDNNDPEIKYWPGYSPDAIVKDANQYLEKHAKDDNPFLLLISIATPHFPHNSALEKDKKLYPLDQLKIAPNVPKELEAKVRKELQGYYGHCTGTDNAIGTVLQKLKDLNLMENTIVVFTSDHGEMMGAHGHKPFVKQLAWDEAIKVPFLISYPSIGDNKGAVVNAPINTPDILPSLLGLAKLTIPSTIEGENLAELIKKPDASADRAALVMGVCPFGTNIKDPVYRAVRTKQYTYIRTIEGPSTLFDNINDPFQMENLINNPELASVQKDLDIKLNEKLIKIGDPFKSRRYYLNKWNYVLHKRKNAIDYMSFDRGEGVVFTPGIDPVSLTVVHDK